MPDQTTARTSSGTMENFVAGAFGGLACVAAGQPLDTIKVKMQTYPHVYTSLYRAVKKTLVEEKLRGFYAGSVPAIVSNVAENAVLFLCYNHCQNVVQWAVGAESRADMSVRHLALSGSLASVFSAAAISPCELVKCKMQTSKLRGKTTTTPVGAVKAILKEDGLMGMYRGLTSTWAREMPGYFCFFTGYNASIKLLTPRGQNPEENLSIWRTGLAGGLAGCGFWGFVFPFDSVKSRIQVRGEYSNSFIRSLMDIIRTEGVMMLYRGLLPTIIRSFPANGALFVIYEYTMKLLKSR